MLVFAPVAALLETTVLIVDPDLANFTSPESKYIMGGYVNCLCTIIRIVLLTTLHI